ncbi:hypothetical protein CC86DRAFT_425947 [Ophiobolus disseminans]|uniref:Uncharacterized protein n=1 Tax=Ophiobolus disseminans TaxID=1469910 RepID=A0A6A6ZNS1_9PLEO|nr:hypothetical protein CC86DRAFT_425947 [Ophiobolus disseminans]
MLEGKLYVDVKDERIRLTPSHGELEVPLWCRNRVIPLPPSRCPGADGAYILDAILHENYYQYMDQELALGGDGISVIQVLCIFDRGGSCLALPKLLPFSLILSRAMTALISQ